MTQQVTELRLRPRPDRVQPIRNPPIFVGGDLVPWLRESYTGNKPFGGLWTSTYTPDDPDYISDWQRGRCTNRLIQAAYPASDGLTGYLLDVNADARVMNILDLDGAVEFTERYHLGATLLDGLNLPAIITPEITNWEAALREYDAIHLTAEAADEIAYALVKARLVTAFQTWNCESTLAGRWIFRNPPQTGRTEMSKYPRIGQRRPIPRRHIGRQQCQICRAAAAVCNIDYEVNEFRGDDEVLRACEACQRLPADQALRKASTTAADLREKEKHKC